MKITIKDGKILSSDKKSVDKNGVVKLEIADKIAAANGLNVAETLVSKHEGRTFILDKALKIVEQVRGQDVVAPKVRLAGTTRTNGKYTFTSEEKADIAKNMAEKHRDKEIVDGERRSAMSSYKDRLDRIDADINKLTRNYLDGYEFRDFECHVEFDWAANTKSYIVVDSGVVISVRALDPSDYQLKMDMVVVPEDKDKKEEEDES